MKSLKKFTVVLIAIAVATALFAGCGKVGGSTKTITGTLAGTDGMVLQVETADGERHDIQITEDTELLSDHQPEEGDSIQVEYREESGNYIAVKAVVGSGQ